MSTPVRRLRTLFPLLAALALASCEGGADPLVPPVGGDGLSFIYGGAASGSYRTSGSATLRADGLPGFGQWAVARADSIGGIVVAGLEPTGGNRGNLFILQLRGRETGEYRCSYLGTGAGARKCYGTLIVGIDLNDLSKPGEYYYVDSGTVTVTSLTGDRIRGTFGVGLRALKDESRRITVTDGRIDVPYAEGMGMFNGLTCLVENLRSGRNAPC
ncbi:MAG: hypothetical protein AB1941_26425 [Gemmatimonadota bacterium]